MLINFGKFIGYDCTAQTISIDADVYYQSSSRCNNGHIMNQILEIITYWLIFIQTHWTSSGKCRDELVELFGVYWSGVKWQGILISDWSQACDK